MGDVMMWIRLGLEGLGAAGLLFSVIARFTRTPKDDEYVSKFRQLIALLSMPLLGGPKVTQVLTHSPSVPSPAPDASGVKRLPLRQR